MHGDLLTCVVVDSTIILPTVILASEAADISEFIHIRSEGGGGGCFKAPLRNFALTHLILELLFCALMTFPKNRFTSYGKENFFIGGQGLVVRGSQSLQLT